MTRILRWLVALSLAVSVVVGLPQMATAADTASVGALFASLTVAPETNIGYDRALFEHWVDADGNGCDTRSEVLQRESSVPVTFGSRCTVATGQWNSWYDGQTWTNASDVDIDHLVPLAEAWGSGARSWTPAQRRAYANDLDLSVSLEAVTDNVNQSKGDRDPAEWMPLLAGTACQYDTDWVLVKYRWHLSIDPAEYSALSSVITNDCASQMVTVPAVAITTTPIIFQDIGAGTAFSTEISWLAAQGITTGWVFPDGTREYRPLSPVNRDAMAAFLYRLAGQPAFTAQSVSPFADVDPSYPFYKEISWLAANGISTGWTEPDGRRTFRPQEPVNRDAMAAFLYRFDGSPAVTTPATPTFVDVPPSSIFYTQITWLAQQGISTGWDLGNTCRAFRPVQPVARDAMAAFMYRSVNGGTGAVSAGCITTVTPPPTPPAPPAPPTPPAPPANPGDAVNCTDFATWQQAQAWFNTYYPYYGDVARLDGDGNGVACQSLPGHP